MADYLDQLIDDFAKGRTGKDGNFVLTPEGRAKMRATFGQAELAAFAVAQKTAKEIAAVSVDLMMNGIDEGALKLMASQRGSSSLGLFSMQEGDSKFGYTLSNADANLQVRRTKFNPADAGRFGKFAESFLFGLESVEGENTRLPDLQKLAAKYGEAIMVLAPELKASTDYGDIHVGGQTVGTSSAKFNENIDKGRDISDPPYSHTPEVYDTSRGRDLFGLMAPARNAAEQLRKDKFAPLDEFAYKRYAKTRLLYEPFFSGKYLKSGELALGQSMPKSKVDAAYSVWKVEVDDFVMRVIAVVKLLQKISSLMVIDVEDRGMQGSNRLFEFKAATIFAQLDVAAIVKGLDKEVSSFNVHVPKEVRVFGSSSKDGRFEGGGASVEISIKNPSKKNDSGSFSMGDYKDSYSLWKDKASRDRFFSNMYDYLKKNNMFAIPRKGSEQEQFNMQNAVSLMEGFQKHKPK